MNSYMYFVKHNIKMIKLMNYIMAKQKLKNLSIIHIMQYIFKNKRYNRIKLFL